MEPIQHLAQLVEGVNALIDAGETDTVAAFIDAAEVGEVIPWLRRDHPAIGPWISYYTSMVDVPPYLEDVFVRHSGPFGAKYGVQNNGLCGVVAVLTEEIKIEAK